jgi:hypothetical protein
VADVLMTPVANLSDIDLDSFIVLVERRIADGTTFMLTVWATRYVELVNERHARVMARGKTQAEELDRAERRIQELLEDQA